MLVFQQWENSQRASSFFYGKISNKCSTKSLHSLGSLSTNQLAKSEACCSGSAVSFVVTSFIIMLASVQLCLSTGQEQWESWEQQTTRMQSKRLTANRQLLSGYAGLSLMGKNLRLYYSCLTSLFTDCLAVQKLLIQHLSLQTFESTLLVMWMNLNGFLPSCSDLSLLNISMKAIKKNSSGILAEQTCCPTRSNNFCLLNRKCNT